MKEVFREIKRIIISVNPQQTGPRQDVKAIKPHTGNGNCVRGRFVATFVTSGKRKALFPLDFGVPITSNPVLLTFSSNVDVELVIYFTSNIS